MTSQRLFQLWLITSVLWIARFGVAISTNWHGALTADVWIKLALGLLPPVITFAAFIAWRCAVPDSVSADQS